MTSGRLRALLLLCSLALVACPSTRGDDDTAGDDDDSVAADDDDATPPPFRIWSPDFVDPYFDNMRDCDQALPLANACEGNNPEVRWEGAPEGTAAFALVFDDPTAGAFAHWAIYNIPGDADSLAAGISGRDITNTPPGDAVELDNGFGWNGYLGSCPQGQNQYRWRLWALSAPILSVPGSFSDLAAAAQALALGEVEMCHVFDGREL